MTELFENINPEVKEYARAAWSLAMSLKTPIEAANFLDAVTNYYNIIGTSEEVEFLRFYFNTQMEMMKR